MNVVVHELPDVLHVQPHQCREVLRCILHTILFCRTLGVVRPKDVVLHLFSEPIVHAQVDDPEVESVVEGRLDTLLAWLASRESESLDVAVKLSFYERRTKQAWFTTSEERLYWEQWRVPLRVQRGPGDAAVGVDPSLRSAVEQSIFFILRAVNDKREHIPPVSAAAVGAISHPFEIGLPSDASGTLALKRLVTSARPPAVL